MSGIKDPWESNPDAWKGEDKSETPSEEIDLVLQEIEDVDRERIRQEKCLIVARLMSPDEFLIVRLMDIGCDVQEIASRIGRTIAEVEAVRTLASFIVQSHLAEEVRDVEEALDYLASYGYQEQCLRCQRPQQDDHRHCCECGLANPHFSARSFAILWGHTHEEEIKAECLEGHPTAKQHGCLGFCNLCGIDLVPITQHPDE